MAQLNLNSSIQFYLFVDSSSVGKRSIKSQILLLLHLKYLKQYFATPTIISALIKVGN